MEERELRVLEEDPWPDKWPGALLPAEAIKDYSDVSKVKWPLIRPFDYKLLRPARYELTLGDEAHVGGRPWKITDRNPLVLEPHQVAVVKTFEYLRVPRFVIGRWNLRVGMVYEGLLWVGGPQVDPGWAGHLYCPIYNLAEREVYLNYRQQMFTIDFVRVFPTGLEDKKFKPARRSLDEHDIHRLRSAPFEELKRLPQLEQRFYGAIGIIFALVAIIMAALGALVASPIIDKLEELDSPSLVLNLIAIGIGAVSFVMSGVAIWLFRPRPVSGTFWRRHR